MIALLIVMQLSATQVTPPDSVYSSPALQRVIEAAAVANREPPPSLTSYTARLESEIAVVIGLTPAGGNAKESAAQLEQVESDVSWRRNGSVDQHVIGYRARTLTASVSALSVLRRPWIVPTLYGERLHLLLGGSAGGDNHPGDGARTAVHPFASDRAAFYRFRGGDTIAVARLRGRAGDRVIHIVRILVEPRGRPPEQVLLFSGEIDLDAARGHIVRMRGEFLERGGRTSILSRLRHLGLRTFAFAELVDGEFGEAYWLPTYQRIEAQGRSRIAAGFRPVFRVVSRFREHALNGDSTRTPDVGDERLTYAPRDSLSAFHGWMDEIGAATLETRSADFDDVATEEQWRTRGAPRLDWRADRVSDVFRFNRVEGLYSGVAASLRLRDAVPGATLAGYGGWAWSEATARGGVRAELLRSPWRADLRVERALANTNDFRPTLDYEASLYALFASADDYDYLDRRSATLSLSREIGGPRGLVLRAESGPVSDRSEPTRRRYGLVHLDSAFRANRPITAGSYLRSGLALEYHPYLSADFLEPGVGGGLWYERGDGALRWQRIESRLVARHTQGPWTYASRFDGAAVFGRAIPLQQLLELGENEGLQGYAYKEFGGDRAMLARGAISYALPLLRAPIHGWRGIVLPSLSPSLAIGAQAGWTGASASTLLSLARFGYRTDSLTGIQRLATRPTDGMRSTASLTLRVFGNALGVGVARPLDHPAPWSFVVSVGQGP